MYTFGRRALRCLELLLPVALIYLLLSSCRCAIANRVEPSANGSEYRIGGQQECPSPQPFSVIVCSLPYSDDWYEDEFGSTNLGNTRPNVSVTRSRNSVNISVSRGAGGGGTRLDLTVQLASDGTVAVVSQARWMRDMHVVGLPRPEGVLQNLHGTVALSDTDIAIGAAFRIRFMFFGELGRKRYALSGSINVPALSTP